MKCSLVFAKVLGDKGDEFIRGKCIGRDCGIWDHQRSCCGLIHPAPQAPRPTRRITTAFLQKVLDMVKHGELDAAIVELGRAIKDMEG